MQKIQRKTESQQFPYLLGWGRVLRGETDGALVLVVLLVDVLVQRGVVQRAVDPVERCLQEHLAANHLQPCTTTRAASTQQQAWGSAHIVATAQPGSADEAKALRRVTTKSATVPQAYLTKHSAEGGQGPLHVHAAVLEEEEEGVVDGEVDGEADRAILQRLPQEAWGYGLLGSARDLVLL